MALYYTNAKIFLVEDIINTMYQDKLEHYEEDIIHFYQTRFPCDYQSNIILFEIDSQSQFSADWTFGVNDILKRYGCNANEIVYLRFNDEWNKLLPEVQKLISDNFK